EDLRVTVLRGGIGDVTAIESERGSFLNKGKRGSLGSVRRGWRTNKIWIGAYGKSWGVGAGAAASAEGIADAAGRRSGDSGRIANGDNSAGLRCQEGSRNGGGNLRGADAGGGQSGLCSVGVPVHRRTARGIGSGNKTLAGESQREGGAARRGRG